MKTLFTPSYRRFFFIYGHIDDQFITPDLKLQNIEQVLQQHLRQLGYQRILFYNVRKGLNSDSVSREYLRPASQRNTKKTPPRSNKLVSSRLGKKRLLYSSAPTTTVENTLNFSKINDLELVGLFDTCMKEAEYKTACILTDGLDFFQHFDRQALREMSAAMTSWTREPHHNENICLFLLFGNNLSGLNNLLERLPQWQLLKDQMFNTENQPTSQMIAITSPRHDEIRKIVHWQRLSRQLVTDWHTFSHAITRLTRQCNSENKSLKALSHELMQCQDLQANSLQHLSDVFDTVSALDRLRKMQGIDNVIEWVEDLICQYNDLQHDPSIQHSLTESDNQTLLRLQPPAPPRVQGLNLHLALKGNPGTGKTTVANLIGEIFRDAGILPLGHTVKASREDLVGNHVGDTALKTAEKISQVGWANAATEFIFGTDFNGICPPFDVLR